MKHRHAWPETSLEALETSTWPPLDPSEGSHLVRNCHALRTKPLRDFEVEDLRVLIGQNLGLTALVPLAIETLEDNIVVEGDFYPGDLLMAVLRSDPAYWRREPEQHARVCALFERHRQTLAEADVADELRAKWFRGFEAFRRR